MKKSPNIIGERIKGKRSELEMTQKGLSDKVGVSQSAINQFEKGIKKPSPAVLRELAIALGTDVNYLLGSAQYNKEFAGIFVDENIAAAFREFKGLDPNDREKIMENIKFLKHFSKQKKKS